MMYSTHLAWIKDKNCMAKKSAYTRAKQKAQSMLHEMKSRRWINKAAELQEAADQHDLKSFFCRLSTVHVRLAQHLSNHWMAEL